MATGVKGRRPSEGAVPPNMASRLEKSRKLAQKRRETYKDLMTSLADELPFSREVVSQVDYNSRLRLALCFFRMKSLGGAGRLSAPQTSQKMLEHSPRGKPVAFQPGVLQDLMIEAMDGFLMVILSDGTIVYLSESVHKHLGLFQSEHMGFSLYDLVLEEDHNDVKEAISRAEARAHARIGTKHAAVPCSFFCRMKCSRFKVANTQMKSPGYKVVHVNGHFRLQGSDPFLVVLVKPVTPPSILEIRMEGNMFVTHYALDMKCIFFDGRLNHLMGYKRNDLEGKPVFDFHHHDDTDATLECSKGIQARGEGMSAYYRMLTKYGSYVWLQTRATMMFDSRTGQPSYIVCMNFVINKDTGNRNLAELEARKALTAPPEMDTKSSISEEGSKSHDPFPIPREDGKPVNPLDDGGASPASAASVPSPEIKSEAITPPVFEEPSSTTTPLKLQQLSHSGVTSTSSYSTSDASQSHSSDECVPDSTTSVTPPSDQQGSSSNTDLGYGSHMGSSSSFHSSNVFSPTVRLVGSSSGSTPKSVNSPIQPITTFSEGTPRTMQPCSVSNSGNETDSSSVPIQNWNQHGATGMQNQRSGMGRQSHDSSSGTSSLSSSVAPSPFPTTTAAETGRVFTGQQIPSHAPQNSSVPLSLPSALPSFPSSLPPGSAQFSHGSSTTFSSSIYQDPVISELQDTNENYRVSQPLQHQGYPHGGQAQNYQTPTGQQVYYQQPLQGGRGNAAQIESQRLQHFDHMTHSGGNSSVYNQQYTRPYIKEEPSAVPSACQFVNAPHAPGTFGSLHHQMGQPQDSGLAPNFNFGQQQPQQSDSFMTTPHAGMGHPVPSGGYQQNGGFGANSSTVFSHPLARDGAAFMAREYPPNQTVTQPPGVPLHHRQFNPSSMPPSSSTFPSSSSSSSSSSAHPQNQMTSSVMFVDTMTTGAPQMTNQTAGLPLLTGEDLKVLDFVEQLDSRGSITQMPTYSQLYTTH